MDIAQLILDDHHEQRRLFALLDQVDAADVTALRTIWAQLADFLELHAEAEEQHFYPALLRRGQGQGVQPDAKAETLDAIKDHNEIRDAIANVGAHAPGSSDWRRALEAARKANSDHMAEEERQGLADFRQHAPLQIRHDLGVLFATFEARHRMGVQAQDKDPKAYVRQHA
jgi:hypothetical protein